MDINELYRNARRGDEVAERQLFDYLAASFRSFIRLKDVDADDAEDVMQTALLRIAESYRQVDIHSSFAGWAHVVLRNSMMEYFRRRSMGRRKIKELATLQAASRTADPDPRLRAGLRECLRAIHERNPAYAQVLALHFEGYTTDEICERLTLTSTNLYTILSRARASLRDCLKQKGVLGV